jgi:hypothetical protein
LGNNGNDLVDEGGVRGDGDWNDCGIITQFLRDMFHGLMICGNHC